MLRFLSLALVGLLLAWTPAMAAKRALVIGNNAYEGLDENGRGFDTLDRAVSDARAYARVLTEEHGFTVTMIPDADRATMMTALGNFVGSIQPGDVVMFVFSGHAMQLDPNRRDQLYLFPTDISVSRYQSSMGLEAYLETYAVSFGRVTNWLTRSGARLRVFVLDACRTAPTVGDGNRTRKGLLPVGIGRVRSSEGEFIFYSAGPGEEALDTLNGEDPKAKGTSVFTRVFLGKFKSGVYLEDIANEVQARVKDLAATSNHVQRPYYSDGVTGWTCLEETCGRTLVRPAEDPIEKSFWKTCADADDPRYCQVYLDQYPTGPRAPLASLRLKELTEARAADRLAAARAVEEARRKAEEKARREREAAERRRRSAEDKRQAEIDREREKAAARATARRAREREAARRRRITDEERRQAELDRKREQAAARAAARRKREREATGRPPRKDEERHRAELDRKREQAAARAAARRKREREAAGRPPRKDEERHRAELDRKREQAAARAAARRKREREAAGKAVDSRRVDPAMSDGGRAAARASDSVANQWRRGVREVAHFDTIHADDIAVSPNRGLLAIRSHTRGYPEDSVEIVLVDIKTGRERRRFRQASGSNRGAFFFGHGGDFLFAGDAEHADDDWTHRLRAIAVDSPRIVGKWRIDMLGIGADRLIAGIVDRTNRIVIIDTATAKTVQEFDGGPKVEDSIDDVRISPNGRLIARRLDRSVKIFDAATAEIVAMHKITPKSGNFGSFGFSADSRRFFVSATSYDEIQSTWVWDARDRNAPWRRLIVCDNHLCEPEISVSGNILIRRAGTIRLVDGARVPEMVRNGGILPGSISPGDRLFAYAVLGDSDEMTLKVVSLADRREIFSQKFEHGLRSVLDEHFFRSRYARFTPDASGLIVSAKLGKGLLTELHLIDASTFETIQIIRFQKLNRIVPIDGYAGFAAIDNGAVRIFKAGAP